MKILQHLRMVACASIAAISFTSWGQVETFDQKKNAVWKVQTVSTRPIADGKTATVALAIPNLSSAPLKHILLFVSPYNAPQLKIESGSTALNTYAPWVIAADALNAQGVLVTFADPPSDAEKRPLPNRAPAQIAEDITVIARHLNKAYPGVPIHLAGFGYGAGALLDAAANVKEVDRIVVASGDFRANRTTDWTAYKHPVMLLHAPSAQCDTSPYFEAELVARKSQFALVQVGYNQTDPKLNCGRGSQHMFTALEAAFATTVAQWLGGAAAPATIGYPTPQVAWREQLLHYTAPAALGTNQLEMTLLLPSGVGPHPVVVFSHGHIEQDTPWVRSAMRFVDLTLAREFLKLGWAVAFPTRQGVGLSEGSNRRSFSTSDGDPTYKARIESKDILPALDRLRSIPEIDASRIIISGQSAGGYAAMHMAGLNLSGVIGVINFSGGRTDMTGAGGAGFINTMMVNGFAEFGKTTNVPMLWVFAENDSRYTANTIRASYKAFTDAGGKATLLLSPPIDIDGHFIHSKPDLWRQALRDYLSALPTEQTKP